MANISIKGSIPYELKVNENNEWEIVYEDGIDNDLAIMAISKSVLETVCAGLSLEKKKVQNTKYERHIKAILDKAKAAHFGLEVVLEYMQNIYIDFKKNNPDEVPSVADEAKAAVIGFNNDNTPIYEPIDLTKLADENN